MGEVSSIVFTGGIGENSAFIRKEIIKNLDFFGIELTRIKIWKFADTRAKYPKKVVR